jgi:FSR family fosmidomycin resistance protein-like MFS transporter
MRIRVRLTPIPRAEGVSGRAVKLGLLGRFTDELFSGLFDVLMPSIRARIGFSYAQVGLLSLVLNYVAAVVEPVNGLLIDVWQRHRLLAWGALGTGLALVVIGVAPSYLVLLLGFALYGTAAGPLAHTADVVLVEAHPEEPGRIYARATLLDTSGALLAPLLVAVGLWAGLDWRWIVAGVGLWGPLYALLLLRTRFPAPSVDHEGAPVLAVWRANLRSVLSSRAALGWLVFLFAHDLLESPLPLTTVWLVDDVGMSQGLVGLYVAVEMAAALAAVAYLDRWLRRTSPRTILATSVAGLFVLYPAWFAVPGAWAKFVIGVPLNALLAMLWPLAQGELLSSVPGRAGALTAVRSLFGFVPLTVLVGLLSESRGLTTSMLAFHLVGLAVMALAIARLPRRRAARVP